MRGKIVDLSVVRDTLNTWAKEDGCLKKTAERMGLHQAALYKARSGAIQIDEKRLKKWERLWKAHSGQMIYNVDDDIYSRLESLEKELHDIMKQIKKNRNKTIPPNESK